MAATLFFVAAFALAGTALPQNSTEAGGTPFRLGEKLTYNVSFERFSNVAYGEIYVASRGRLADKDAIELHARFKTLDFVSSAFFLVDETRTTFASAETGLPLFTSRTLNPGGMPREINNNYLTAPTPNLDLLTLIYKLRYSGGSGAFTFVENDKTYTVTFQQGVAERVKTDAGEFDTVVVSVQSDFVTDLGLKDLRINLTTDDAKLPALVRFRMSKGEFRAQLASVQLIEPEVDPQPSPTPVPVRTPRPESTPRPSPTPTPYIDNQPLGPELAFGLGETLSYNITNAGRPVGSFKLQAKERKQFMGADSLLLTAVATAAQPGSQVFSPGDYIRAYVDPESMAARQIEIKLTGPLSSHNRTATFDQKGSVTTSDGGGQIDAPVGTQSILSVLYALRSFNLKPSHDRSNPVNDTRVAVFWDKQPYIFTLRPSEAENIDLGGKKVSAQMISVSTTNEELNPMGIRVWLSNDEHRLPLRIIIGSYQADLVSSSIDLSQ